MTALRPRKITVIVHYFPPINSSGAKRWHFTSQYLARRGHDVTVITTRKTGADGAFTEAFPDSVQVIELNQWGRASVSEHGTKSFAPMYSTNRSFGRWLKDHVQAIAGQVPDPRLPFSFAFLAPFLDGPTKARLLDSDVVIGSCPPWTMLLAAYFTGRKFKRRFILDYRDQFSGNAQMPGSRVAKLVETTIDRILCRRADHVVAISGPMRDYYHDFFKGTALIINGYDHETFEKVAETRSWTKKHDGQPLKIRYMGIVTPRAIPEAFLSALEAVNARRPELVKRIGIEYFGANDAMRAHVKKYHPNLQSLFSFFPPVPYSESIGTMLESDYLLFSDTSDTAHASSRGVLTTKLFEYIASGRPIIADIAGNTLAGELIRQAGAQHVVSNDPTIFETMLEAPAFLMPIETVQSAIAPRLSRSYQADRYAELIENMVP